MNQGKLEVVKQQMSRVNIDILGIIELKWTGMDEFNSDDHYIYYHGQESLRRNGVDIVVDKSLKCTILYLVAQSCLTLCDPMDCSLPGSSVLRDFPGKNTGVDCHFLLQGIFPT